MFSLHYRETAFSPYFSQLHHRQVFRRSYTGVFPEKRRIAATGQNSSPSTDFIQTAALPGTKPAILLCCLVVTQVFPRRLIAIQFKQFSFWTDKSVLLLCIEKAIFFRSVGKLNCGNISGNTKKLQSTMDSACVISPIQSNLFYWNTVLYLTLQMPQNQEAFSLVGSVHIYS